MHRYFGAKQNLMRAAMAKSQRAIAANLSEMTDVRRDLGLLYQATVGEKEFVAVLARASLDGVLPEFPAGTRPWAASSSASRQSCGARRPAATIPASWSPASAR